MNSTRSGTRNALCGAAGVLLATLALVAASGGGPNRIAALVVSAAANLGALAWIYLSVSRERRETRAETGAQNERLELDSAIIEGSDDAIISKNLDGVIQSWNGAAERIFGFSTAEAVGRPISIIIPDDRLVEEAGIIERIKKGERVDKYETVRRRSDGGLVEIAVTVSPVRDAQGRITGASKIARDISVQKRFDREMVAALTELRDIKAAIDVHSIVAITDAAGRITYVNEKFCAISKYGREELLGQDHRIINSGYHPKEFFRDLWATIGSGAVWHGEIKNRAKDGSLYWVETTIFPRMSEKGKPTQYIAIRTDITQRKADEIELQRSAQELLEKNRELETIVYTVSHDLRSPLVNVQGFGRQLSRACERVRSSIFGPEKGTIPPEEVKQAVETTIPQALRFINAGATKMDLLLAGLLRYSRMGRITLNIVPLEMNGLLAEIVAAMRYQLNEAKADVRVEPLPGCLGDAVHTSQVFANLLENALKYRDRSRQLQVTVSGVVRDGLAVYSVADNGIGIAPEHQGKIFEIFHRLDPSAAGGEGLGLTIAQRVLERQRGKIWIESKEGSGSTFFVSLPGFDQQ